MSSRNTLRRWPRRNFLQELEPELRDTHSIDDLARREPSLRRARGALKAAARSVRAQVSTKEWIQFADALSAVQTAEFELAFNLGFEHGLIAARAELLANRRRSVQSASERLFRAGLRRAMAASEIPSRRVLAALLEFCWAFAMSAPDMLARTRRAP